MPGMACPVPFRGLDWAIEGLLYISLFDPPIILTCTHQQNKTYLIPLITSYSLLKPLILGVRMK